MKHCMLDLETWGTSPGCAIRSIGAVMFDPSGDIGIFGDAFYRNITDRSCWMAGLRIDPATVKWWDGQSDAVSQMLNSYPSDLKDAVAEFHSWFLKNHLQFIWCEGATFDEPVWHAAVRAVGLSVPWSYRDVRDTRTAYAMADFDRALIPRQGVAHNALDDARHQAICVQSAFYKLEMKSISLCD